MASCWIIAYCRRLPVKGLPVGFLPTEGEGLPVGLLVPTSDAAEGLPSLPGLRQQQGWILIYTFDLTRYVRCLLVSYWLIIV